MRADNMTLKEKISQKQALVGIIGLGYVGLPLVLRFGEVGFKILGFDSDAQKVDMLNQGESYIKHIPGEGIAKLRQSQRNLKQQPICSDCRNRMFC